MVDRDSRTLSPPPPSAERDMDAEHKQLTLELADHPDPRVRILAHLSTRQFEISERLSMMEQTVAKGFEEVGRKISEGFRDLRDKVDALDQGFMDVEERTSALEVRHPLNGSSSPTQ